MANTHPKPAAAAGTKKPKNSAPGKRPADYRVRIRMYRQGLGDCFLLSFHQGEGEHVHMLIDCGVVLGTGEPGAVMTQVAQNVYDVTGGKLDYLVITHEHWDHLSGFDEKQAREVFSKFKIGKLWLGWTEDDTDDLALQLRDERERKKKAAQAAKKAAEKKAGGKKTEGKKTSDERKMEKRAQRLAEVLGLFGARASGGASDDEDGGGGTAGALKFLKKKRSPTIIETGKSYEMAGVEGTRVYVVGPPKDGDAMKQTNPFKGEGYGLADDPIGLAEAFLAGFNRSDETAQPFAKHLRRSLKRLETRTQRLTKTRAGQSPAPVRPGLEGYYHWDTAWRNIDDAWLATGERLALQLDNATNNTSLVLAFELPGGDVLFFVGDAQAGNWRSWDKITWKVKEGDAERREVKAEDLLRRTIFYKVGHHGSHNATLRDRGLELMQSERLAACIPVDTNVAHEVKGWEHMPLPAIRDRLKQKCALLFQTDEPTLVNKKKKSPGTWWEESEETFPVRMKDKKTKKMTTVRTQSLYTDYFV